MAATVVVKEGNDSPVAWTTITEARFCTTDDYNPGSTYPCVIPGSGTYYSYWKHWLLNLSGSFTQINNVRIYTDGELGWTLGTGGRVVIGQKDDPEGDDAGHGCPTANYEQSAGTEGTTGYAIKDADNGHDYYKDEVAAVADLFSFDSETPCTIDSADHTSAENTKAAVCQAEIKSDATQGTMSSETITFVYDEI